MDRFTFLDDLFFIDTFLDKFVGALINGIP
jgi:hypothetical protein